MGGAVYAVAGGKGGIGKTTTAINLGVVLGQTGQDVVVVDADLAMANVGQRLGIDHEPTIHQVLAGDATVRDAVVTGPAGLRVITGERALDSFATAEPTELDGVLDLLAVAYDVVLVDTGAGVQRNGVVTYRKADGVVLVTTADEVAITDANRTAAVAADADCPTVGAVVTKAESGTAPDAVAGLDADVLAVVPAHQTGGPVTASEPNSDAAGTYRTLAASLPAVDAEAVVPADSPAETERSGDSDAGDGSEREETASP